jgi:RecB family endonuclease NucS
LKPNVPVKTSGNPSLGEAKELITDALERGMAALIVGSCEISYKGRASSTLGAGERIVFITKDKALLIHRSYGYKPVNWQPAGCKFRVESRSDNKLEITGVRMKPLESVRITFGRIYSVLVLDLSDESAILMYGSELEMKKAVLYDPNIVENGFTPITSEKRIPSGFVDIFGRDKDGKHTIIEIKKGKATREAALQLARYVEPFRRQDPHVRGILVAEGMAKGTEKSIASLNLEYRRLSIKKCSEILRKISRNEEEVISDYF